MFFRQNTQSGVAHSLDNVIPVVRSTSLNSRARRANPLDALAAASSLQRGQRDSERGDIRRLILQLILVESYVLNAEYNSN